jgi:hypothetical protein
MQFILMSVTLAMMLSQRVLCKHILVVDPQNVSLSLAQRQALQRAQQMKFLKEQGLINNEKDVKGGAGSDKSVASRGPKPLSRREKLAKASRKEPARLASV